MDYVTVLCVQCPKMGDKPILAGVYTDLADAACAAEVYKDWDWETTLHAVPLDLRISGNDEATRMRMRQLAQ